jgi:hypothetical protein
MNSLFNSRPSDLVAYGLVVASQLSRPSDLVAYGLVNKNLTFD